MDWWSRVCRRALRPEVRLRDQQAVCNESRLPGMDEDLGIGSLKRLRFLMRIRVENVAHVVVGRQGLGTCT